jgi:diguanylate cyclase (GGDEF)-like protein
VAEAPPGAPKLRAQLDLASWLAEAAPHRGLILARSVLARVLADTEAGLDDPALAGRAYLVRGQARLVSQDLRAAHADLQEAARRSAAAGDQATSARALLMRGICLGQLGDGGSSAVLMDQAVELFGLLGMPEGQARALDAAAAGHLAHGRLDEAKNLLERALSLAESSGDPVTLGLVLLNKGQVALCKGLRVRHEETSRGRHRLQEALDWFDRALVHARDTDFRMLEPRATAYRAATCAHLGRVTEGLEGARRALHLAVGLGSPELEAISLYCLGLARHVAGDFDGAVAALGQADETCAGRGRLADQVTLLRALVDAHEAAGNLAEALAAHRRLLTVELALREDNGLNASQVLAARVEAQRERAAAERERRRSDKLAELNRRLADESEQLSRLAHTDPLTGLANRRFFDVQLPRLLLQAELSGSPVSLVLVDIDHFKGVNDAHTHLVGDEVLRRLSRELAGHCRNSDLAARIGGEEFAVVLPDTSLVEACAAAERLRTAVSAIDLTDLHPGLRVTVSVGVASAQDAEAREPLFGAADAELYVAKRAGRNTVRPVATPVESGAEKSRPDALAPELVLPGRRAARPEHERHGVPA